MKNCIKGEFVGRECVTVAHNKIGQFPSLELGWPQTKKATVALAVRELASDARARRSRFAPRMMLTLAATSVHPTVYVTILALVGLAWAGFLFIPWLQKQSHPTRSHRRYARQTEHGEGEPGPRPRSDLPHP